MTTELPPQSKVKRSLSAQEIAEIRGRDALWYDFMCDADGKEVPARMRHDPASVDRRALLAHVEAAEGELANERAKYQAQQEAMAALVGMLPPAAREEGG